MSIDLSDLPHDVAAACELANRVSRAVYLATDEGPAKDIASCVLAGRSLLIRESLKARALEKALQAIVDDLKARWDMNSPTTNPGIRTHVEYAEGVIDACRCVDTVNQ